jgi:hypothetical protein
MEATLTKYDLFTILTTEEGDEKIPYRRSAYLAGSGERPVAIDNLVFNLYISVPKGLDRDLLEKEMIKSYGYQLDKDLEEQADRTDPSVALMEVELSLYRKFKNELYKDDGEGSMQDIKDKLAPSSALFITSIEKFPLPAYAPIKKNLPNSEELCIKFTNHLLLQYFIVKFRFPFSMDGEKVNIRVLFLADRAKKQDAILFTAPPSTYIDNQLLAFPHGKAHKCWRFTDYTLSECCLIESAISTLPNTTSPIGHDTLTLMKRLKERALVKEKRISFNTLSIKMEGVIIVHKENVNEILSMVDTLAPKSATLPETIKAVVEEKEKVSSSTASPKQTYRARDERKPLVQSTLSQASFPQPSIGDEDVRPSKKRKC